MKQKSQIGFYFHIPFCPHICPYCDFIKTNQFQKKDINFYFKGLELQLDYFLSYLQNLNPVTNTKLTSKYATAYFGGGTPGLFKGQFYLPLLNKIKEYFLLEEVTIETNPYTNYEKNFLDYRNNGFDRITLGAQSLCPKVLQALGRKHCPEDVLKNIEWAKKSGFENIQVDLIYGLKKEVRSLNIEDEIQTLYNTGATGVSAYFLTIEKRTLFANSNLLDEENGVEEYFKILKKCNELGLKQIETSNFSKFEAKHNNLYWYGLPYIGVGTGAHGLLPANKENPYGIRYKIGSSIQAKEPGNDLLVYRDSFECKKNFKIIFDPPRSKKEYLEECIFTFLRTPSGIELDWLIEYTEDLQVVQKLLRNAKFARALAEGKLLLNEKRLCLNALEKIRGDAWALEFISTLF